ncbi:hypothetical protein [Streptacidiphilus sp. EB129]|uniref:hypothetical protein n=1 Tax=Streptacidiphilus sp. EB129 TaxID=3156262 RepID=UPI003514983F
MRRHTAVMDGGGARPRTRAAACGLLVAVPAALMLLLSGCGIRDTSVPVDAGEAASRTACPPSPNATLTVLEHDESWMPLPTAYPWPEPTGTAQVVWPAASAQASKEALARKQATRATPTASPATSASPAATAPDGTLACLHDPTTPAGSGTGQSGATGSSTGSSGADGTTGTAGSSGTSGTDGTTGSTAGSGTPGTTGPTPAP